MGKTIWIASAAAALAALPGTAMAMDGIPGGGGHGGGGGSSGGGGGSPTSVPEPGTIVLLGGGLMALGVARRIRRRR